MLLTWCKYLAVILLIGLSPIASATLVTETWQSTITYHSDGVFNVGDTFSWTVSYDDASQRMNQYQDSGNELGEFGAGDDIWNHSWCTDAYTGTETCTDIHMGYQFMADATFDISQFYNPLKAAGLTGFDGMDENRSFRSLRTGDSEYAVLLADDISFNLSAAYTTFCTSMCAYRTTTHFDSVLVNHTGSMQVPEPTTIVLLAIGVAGIGFRQKTVSYVDFYNQKRRHSSLGYKSPDQFEQQAK